MEGFISYSGFKVGASHVAKNMGCEDFAATYEDEKVNIAVISDGHGDRKCFRSAQGAHIACDVSIENVRKMIDSSPDSCTEIRKSPDRIITELERNIIREWNRSVLNDLNNNPISDDELENLPEDVVEAIRSGRSLNKIYGCTLIMCVVIDKFWFGIHIGDGKCVVALNNGLYTQPIPWDDEGCVGNRSTSICNSNSFAAFRYTYGTDIPTGLFVASDGVDESFDESGLNRCYYTLGYWVQTLQGAEINSKMEELLAQVTQNGSGDDVSIACILSKKNEIKKPYASSEQVAEKLKELIDKIKSQEAHFDDLSDSKEEVTNKIDEFKSEISDLKKKIAILEERLNDKEQELLSIDNNLRETVIQLQKSVIQLPKAKDTKERIDQYWKENGVEIKTDIELNYTPKYSEENLGDVIDKIENSRNSTISQTENERDNLIAYSDVNTSNKQTLDEMNGEKQSAEPKTIADRQMECLDSQEEMKENRTVNENRKLIDKSEQKCEEAESKDKGTKPSFLGNLFGRKK